MSWKRFAALVAILVLVAVAFTLQETSKRRRAAPVGPGEVGEEPQTAGNRSAPISIQAYYPLNEGHRFIAEYLIQYAEEHPEDVHVTVYDMQTPEGMKRWRASGLDCAGVFVNGKTKHEVKRDGKTETVDLVKRMGVMWTQEDFEAIIEQLRSEQKG